MILERTRFATGINNSNKYRREQRQIATIVDPDLFDLVKAEALREGVSISELVRMCIELVLKP